jgi:CHAD domain-containing protein
MSKSALGIESIDRETPVADAARALLAERLGKFAKHVGKAQAEPGEERRVHKLRTSARRAEATLKAFGDVLPAKTRRKARKRIKEIRRAAGVARDADVHAELFENRLTRVHDLDRAAAIGVLMGRIAAQRERATAMLIERLEGACGWAEALAAKLPKAVGESNGASKAGKQPLGDFAQCSVQVIATAFLEAGEEDLSQAELLHELRIAGKRLRYALETLSPGLNREHAREATARLSDFQERLGHVNDLYEQANRIAAVREATTQKRLVHGLFELLEDVEEELEREHAAVLRWWWDHGPARRAVRSLLAHPEEAADDGAGSMDNGRESAPAGSGAHAEGDAA